jgi:hypothetical protein
MKTLHIALALGLLSLVVACGDDGETTTTGGGGDGPGSGGADAGSGGDTSSPSSSNASGNSQGSNSASTASTASGEGGSGDGGSGAGGEGTGGSNGCRDAAPADRDRFVVVGHPFGTKDYVNDWEVLALSAAGVLTTTDIHFEMGVAEDGKIVFTPDGRIGVAVQRDGTLGIFSIDDEGQVTVIDDGFGAGEFYADNLTMEPDGSAVIVGDGNTTENGGGLYRVALDCETGAPTLDGLMVDVNNAWGVVDLGDGRYLVASQGGALGVEDGSDVTDLREGDPWTIADGADAFPYDGVTVGAFAAERLGKFLLVGDFSGFGDEPNNLAFVSIEPDGLTANEAVIPMDTPYAASISPNGEVALIVSYFGDALYVVDIDATSNTPISYRGELEYEGDATLLPGKLTTVDRGSLLGLTLVAELYGVRVVSFDGDGVVTDHGVTETPETEISNGSPVAIGVQP